MRTTLLLLALLAGSALASQTVWKWVDDKGVTHYSDRAVPGATRMEMSGGSKSSSTPSSSSFESPPPGAEAAEPEAPYTEFTIWQPSDSETIANTGGAVTIGIRLQPGLKPGHSLFLYMDGKLVQGAAENALSFDLQEVPRGTHSVIAVINDGSNKRVQESASVTFFVRQESAAQPPVGPSMRPPPKPRPSASTKPTSQPTYAALNPSRPQIDPATNKVVVPKAKPQPVATPKGP
jgi:hypothetical protein